MPSVAATSQHRTDARKWPTARNLLAQLAPAATRKGSVHIDGRFDVTAVKLDSTGKVHPWMHVVTTSRSDRSYTDDLLENFGTLTDAVIANGKTVTHRARQHQIVVGRRAANQVNGGAWSCQLDRSAHPPAPVFQLGLAHPVFNPVNRGPTTLNGIPVWHVQGTITTRFIIASSNPVLADYYVNRHDGTLVQERAAPTADVTTGAGAGTVHEHAVGTMTLTYSQWGKPLQITLPAACRPTP